MLCRNYLRLAKEAADADEATFKQEEERALLKERRLTAEAELAVLQARQKAEALGLASPLVSPAATAASPAPMSGYALIHQHSSVLLECCGCLNGDQIDCASSAVLQSILTPAWHAESQGRA